MLDFSAIPVKLGEPKRLAALGFGAGALILGVVVDHVDLKYMLFGAGLVALSMTLAGYLNPVTVHPGLAGGASSYAADAGSGIVDVGKGRVMPVYGEAYGTQGATAFTPAGPATLAIQQVTNRYQAPMRYITGVENEGQIVGQGG